VREEEEEGIKTFSYFVIEYLSRASSSSSSSSSSVKTITITITTN
jgi:hypothetical protein